MSSTEIDAEAAKRALDQEEARAVEDAERYDDRAHTNGTIARIRAVYAEKRRALGAVRAA